MLTIFRAFNTILLAASYEIEKGGQVGKSDSFSLGFTAVGDNVKKLQNLFCWQLG
jgi:hypothetical protein